MQELGGKVAVVTGGGTGIGRELVRQLVAEGCQVAFCDVIEENLDETLELCRANNPHGVKVTGFICDVTDESKLQLFFQEVRDKHSTEHINLLINNAGINGGGSFVRSTRDEWERTFNICWTGVYLVTRTFLPLLLKSTEGHLVNMSSANAIRPVLGGNVPHTAYSTAKYAVRGFTESLIHDFRYNAPHLSVSVVMPGHTGTGIISNSLHILGQNQPEDWTDEEIESAKTRWSIAGVENAENMAADEVRTNGVKEIENMETLGMPATDAAAIILDGVKSNTWRILIGTDTISLDKVVRESPETAYDPDFVYRWRDANNKLSES